MEAPKNIFLQVCGDCQDNECSNCKFTDLESNATWCIDKIFDKDVEYIRADVLDDLITKSAVWFANRYQANGSYLCAADVEDYEKEIKEYLKQK